MAARPVFVTLFRFSASSVVLPRWLLPALVAGIVFCFGIRNLPWHLDDYDQAKQAFVSWEMVQEGHWYFQHTPTGRIATKPPLAGWISAGLAEASGGGAWELAWRLPPFASSLVLLLLLLRAGGEAGGTTGAALAAGAFGLNIIAQRLATLVRTDMLLTLSIFLIGYLIYRKLRRDTPWQPRDRWCIFLVLLASFLIKGPIAYGFLVPGLLLFWWLQRRTGRPAQAWCGWWPWAVPLLIFGLWVGAGIFLSQDFYQQVVLTEFLGRFQSGEGAPHRSQPIWFYIIHLLYRFFPWSLALICLACVRDVRDKVRRDPALLWLFCWAIGGLLFMSVIPSKRLDRIFPVIPPLGLLLGAAASMAPLASPFRLTRCRLLGTLAAGFLASGIYLSVMVVQGYRTHQGGLKAFGAEARRRAGARPMAVVSGKDEGMLLYLGATHFTRAEDALTAWQKGTLNACVLPEDEWLRHKESWSDREPDLRTGHIRWKNSAYVLFLRSSPGT